MNGIFEPEAQAKIDQYNAAFEKALDKANFRLARRESCMSDNEKLNTSDISVFADDCIQYLHDRYRDDVERLSIIVDALYEARREFPDLSPEDHDVMEKWGLKAMLDITRYDFVNGFDLNLRILRKNTSIYESLPSILALYGADAVDDTMKIACESLQHIDQRSSGYRSVNLIEFHAEHMRDSFVHFVTNYASPNQPDKTFVEKAAKGLGYGVPGSVAAIGVATGQPWLAAAGIILCVAADLGVRKLEKRRFFMPPFSYNEKLVDNITKQLVTNLQKMPW